MHGGVRYLEKAVFNLDRAQLKLVYEALQVGLGRRAGESAPRWGLAHQGRVLGSLGTGMPRIPGALVAVVLEARGGGGMPKPGV